VTNGLSVSQDAFKMSLTVPDDLVGEPTEGDGEWAAWQGVTCVQVGGKSAVVLISITATAFHPGRDASDALAARLRAKYPEYAEHPEYPAGGACIEQFATRSGNPAVAVRRIATQRVNGRDVTTGQAQALVAYPGAGALGVVSGIALDPDALDLAAELVVEIAAGMTVTSAPAAA
jgi:hypothetical protein